MSSLSLSILLFKRQDLSLHRELSTLARLTTVDFRDPPVSVPLVLGMQGFGAIYGFYVTTIAQAPVLMFSLYLLNHLQPQLLLLRKILLTWELHYERSLVR